VWLNHIRMKNEDLQVVGIIIIIIIIVVISVIIVITTSTNSRVWY